MIPPAAARCSTPGQFNFYTRTPIRRHPGTTIMVCRSAAMATTLFEGTADDNQIDTLYMRNSNISQEVVYSPDIPGEPDQLQGDVVFTDVSTANPAYHAAISGSIGPLLFNLTLNNGADFVDFISKSAWQQITGTETSSPTNVLLT